MRHLLGSALIVCSVIASTSVFADPKLFNVELKGISRDKMRTVLAGTAVKPIREDDHYWVDKYNANGVLEGATDLNFGYSSNGQFAYAEYKFPAFVNTSKIIDVANLVASKYGQPSQRSGNTSLGEASLTWNFKNGMAIVVYRGWPDTTTFLQIKDKMSYNKMKAEMDAQEKKQFQQKAKQQQAAF